MASWDNDVTFYDSDTVLGTMGSVKQYPYKKQTEMNKLLMNMRHKVIGGKSRNLAVLKRVCNDKRLLNIIISTHSYHHLDGCLEGEGKCGNCRFVFVDYVICVSITGFGLKFCLHHHPFKNLYSHPHYKLIDLLVYNDGNLYNMNNIKRGPVYRMHNWINRLFLKCIPHDKKEISDIPLNIMESKAITDLVVFINNSYILDGCMSDRKCDSYVWVFDTGIQICVSYINDRIVFMLHNKTFNNLYPNYDPIRSSCDHYDGTTKKRTMTYSPGDRPNKRTKL